MKKIDKKDSIWVNYIYNTLYNILILAVPLITTPYISRVLSVESIGIASYTHSLSLYFTAFVALGTKSYAIKKIARSKNKREISMVFWNVFALRFLIGLSSLAVYYITVVLNSQYKFAAIMQGVYILSVVFDISWFFQGIEKFKVVVFRNAIQKLISVALIFIFVKSDSQFPIYLFLAYGFSLVANISIWPSALVFLEKVRVRDIKPLTDFKEIITLFIPTLALQIYAALDKTMIGAMSSNMKESGLYEQASKITALLLTIITSLSIVALPRIASLYYDGEHNKVRERMKKSFMFTQMLALPMIFGLMSLGDIVIPWFLGKSYVACVSITSLLSVLFIIDGMSNLTGFQYLVATDRQMIYSISIAFGTAMNCIFNWLLIPHLGAKGAVLASLASEGLVLFIQLFYIVIYRKELSVFDVFAGVPRYLLCSVIMYFVVIALKRFVAKSFIGIGAIVIIAVAVYFSLLLLMKDAIFKEILFARFLTPLKKKLSSKEKKEKVL